MSSEQARFGLENLVCEMDLIAMTPVVISGQTAYISGQLAFDDNLKLVAGGIEAETRQCLINFGKLLRRVGLSYEDEPLPVVIDKCPEDYKAVVKTTVFLTDLNDFEKMNSVYKQFFPKNFPSRSAVKVAGLALGARIEIEGIATFGHAIRPLSKL